MSVDFYQMADIVDAFGGVDMDLTAVQEEPPPSTRTRANLEQDKLPALSPDGDYIPSTDGTVQLVYGEYQAGTYHLTGNAAVAYARIRYIDSDDVRASRQQKVLSALLHQLKRKSIFQYPSLIRKVSGLCETSLGVGRYAGDGPDPLGRAEAGDPVHSRRGRARLAGPIWTPERGCMNTT